MLELGIDLGLESEKRVMICPSESSRERFEVSHVIVECRVINHHPCPMPAGVRICCSSPRCPTKTANTISANCKCKIFAVIVLDLLKSQMKYLTFQ